MDITCQRKVNFGMLETTQYISFLNRLMFSFGLFIGLLVGVSQRRGPLPSRNARHLLSRLMKSDQSEGEAQSKSNPVIKLLCHCINFQSYMLYSLIAICFIQYCLGVVAWLLSCLSLYSVAMVFHSHFNRPAEKLKSKIIA